MPNQNETGGKIGRRAFIGFVAATGVASAAAAIGLDRAFRSQPAGADVPPPSPSAYPSVAPSVAPSTAPAIKSADVCPPGGFPPEAARLSDHVSSAIQVPRSMSDVQPAQLNVNNPQRKWFHPIYNTAEADAAHNFRGIGPWAPVYIEGDAANLETHGNLGEFIIKQRKGGRVTVGIMQLQNHQNETKFSSETGSAVQNSDWTNQYTFKGMLPGTEIRVVDPDTGRQHLWPDGLTPVIYKPSANGDFSVEIPKACGDVRVAFSFTLPSPTQGEQLLEIKVERGANNHPELKGEVPLPKGVIKTAIAGQ